MPTLFLRDDEYAPGIAGILLAACTGRMPAIPESKK